MKFKEILEYTEAIVTILGFVLAIWGSLTLLESEVMMKVKELIDYHHSQIK